MVQVRFSYNLQEYWGTKFLLYYPKVRLDSLSQYNFSRGQPQITFAIYGTNFINSKDLICKLHKNILDAQGQVVIGEFERLSSHIFFENPASIQCTFKNLLEIDADVNYRVSVANNRIQFVEFENGKINLRETVWMRNISPKIFLTRGKPAGSHT